MGLMCDYCSVLPAAYVIEEEQQVLVGVQPVAVAYAPLFYICSDCCVIIWREKASLRWWRRYLQYSPKKVRISCRGAHC